MPEWGMLPLPQKLLKQGVRDMVRVSDGRMSGTSYGACVLHVAPESAVGGPLALVRDGLTAVVEESGGTGVRARVPGLRVAGKTGTAQVVRLDRTEGLEEHEIPIRHRDHAWFGAFAPADDPQIALAVVIEGEGTGGTTAAPIAADVLGAFFSE